MIPTSCSGCGGKLWRRFERVLDAETKESFGIDACVECGLGHTSPRPEDLARYYGQSYYGGRHGVTARYCARRRVRFLLGALPSSRGSLLDVGCGDGAFLEMARTLGFHAVGVEPGAAAEQARQRGLAVHGKLEDAVGPSPYVAITLWHSLEHVPDPGGTLSRLRGLLAHDGALLVAVPDAQGLQARLFGRHWLHLDVPRHLHHFGRKSLSLALHRAGFDVVSLHHQEIEYDLSGFVDSALDLPFPGRRVFLRRLQGRPRQVGAAAFAAAMAASIALCAVGLPATMAGTALKRGGTLIAFARPCPCAVRPDPAGISSTSTPDPV